MGSFGRLVGLAVQVVPWHSFNLIGFRPVDLQASHSKYQGRGRQAEAFGFPRGGIDFLGQAFAFTWVCHSCSPPKVRDEKSHICCRAAEEARNSVARNDRKLATNEGFPQTSVRPAARNHRTDRTSGDRSFAARSVALRLVSVSASPKQGSPYFLLRRAPSSHPGLSDREQAVRVARGHKVPLC